MKGFTLIELLIVIGASAILVAISAGVYLTLFKRSDIDTEARKVKSVLNLVRNQTVASKGDQVFGVHFDTSSNEYILFSGSTFNPLDSENEAFPIPSQVTLSSIEIQGGGNDIVFDRLEGTTVQYGFIILAAIEDASDSATICIAESGSIYIQTPCTPTPAEFTGIRDSRHLDFDLGWSIQGATTLALTFHDLLNPDVTENVSMEDYFSNDNSEFDWEGSTDVNGDTETLHVHTHYLDGNDTILSIHRDRRNNQKAVDISIDDRAIVSYAADGTPTVGADGGIMIYR